MLFPGPMFLEERSTLFQESPFLGLFCLGGQNLPCALPPHFLRLSRKSFLQKQLPRPTRFEIP